MSSENERVMRLTPASDASCLCAGQLWRIWRSRKWQVTLMQRTRDSIAPGEQVPFSGELASRSFT